MVAARKKRQREYAKAARVAEKAANQSGRQARNTLKSAEGMRNRARTVLTDELKEAQRKLKKAVKAPIPLDQPLKLKPSTRPAKPEKKGVKILTAEEISHPGSYKHKD